MTRNEAFTLIELLLVIVVIVLLVAILLPVFANARRQATKTVVQTISFATAM